MVVDPGRIPGPQIIPNTVEVVLNWELANGKVVHNVLHGRVAGGFSATSPVAEAIRTAITSGAAWTGFAAQLNDGVTFLGVSLRDLRAPNMPLVESTGAGATGTGAGVALPPEVALCVTLRTALAGRGFRGRVYLPGFDTDALYTDGRATNGAITASTTFVQHIQAAMTASGLTLGIAQPARQAYTSPATGTAIPARSATIVDVTSIVTRNGVFDSQRRRSQ
jgi:hypothetical protein